MEPFYILSQVLAFFGIVLTIIAFWQKKKTNILKFTITSGLLYASHYILLGAWSGVVNNIISVIRDYYIQRFGKKSQKFFPLLVFLGAYIIMTIITFDSYKSLLPLCAVIIYSICVYYCGEQRIRVAKIISCLLWLAYNFLVFSVIGVISDLLVITFTVFAYVKYYKKKRSKN